MTVVPPAAQSFAQSLPKSQRPAWLAYAAAQAERDAQIAASLAEIRRLLADTRERIGPVIAGEVAFAMEPIQLHAASLGALVDALNAVVTRLERLEAR